jgi:lipopolysaccharide biosynthesis glycosyltransferase
MIVTGAWHLPAPRIFGCALLQRKCLMSVLPIQHDIPARTSVRERSVPEPIVLVSGCDDAFALLLGVMLHSVVTNLDAGDHIHIYLLDGGISEANKARIKQVLTTRRVSVQLEWLTPDFDRIQTLPVRRWHKPVAYTRLLIPELLPADVDVALYLDPDVVVHTNLRDLYETDLQNALALGVADYVAPYAASDNALPGLYRQLGLAPDAPCCNTGVMLINLRRWRDEQVGRRVLDFTREYSRYVQWSDQDGINAILGGDWGLLDPRWNVQLSTIMAYRSHPTQDAAERRRVQDTLLQSPFILHYTGKTKPWSFAYRKPHGERFLHYVRTSGWFDTPTSVVWSYSRQISQLMLYNLARAKWAVRARVRGN